MPASRPEGGAPPSIQLRVLFVSPDRDRVKSEPGALDQARSLDEALLLLGQKPYDAVVVDVSAPGSVGSLAVIGEHAPQAALVALTPSTPPERSFEAWQAGAQECLSVTELDGKELQRAARRALERKWLTSFLEERVHLLEGAFQSASPGIALLGAAGNLAVANRSWRAFAEKTGDALSSLAVGANLLEALDSCGEASAGDLAAGIRLVLSGQIPGVPVELTRIVDGEPRWFLVQVDPMPERLGVVLTQTDITDRKHAEEALRQSEVDHRRLLEDLPHGVAVHRDGVFLWVNRAALSILGRKTPDQLVGRRVSTVVHPDDLEHLMAPHAVGEAPDPSRDLRLLRADGSTALVETRLLPVVFDGSPATLILGSDVAEHRAMTARMMELDRMSSAGLLAAALGHEIKNPLAFVSANVDIALRDAADLLRLLEEEPGPDVARSMTTALREIRGALQDARQGARRIEAVVGDLRAFSRPEQRDDAPVDIERVLTAAVNMARNEIRHRARLVKKYSTTKAVRGSEAQLGQVLLNLLTNAADAIGVGDAARNEIAISLYSKDERVIIEISDTGCGIPATDLSRVFDAFYTTKPVGQGTGLGLAICRNIVEAAGGSIEVQSEVGHGTTVRIALLAAGEQPAPPQLSTISPLKPLDEALRVLVVDDEPLIGRAVARCLGKRHHVCWVASGREALETLQAEPFDVVFLDVMMPDMTGIEVYERVQAEAPALLPRIVFVTGGAFTPAARQFLEATPNRQLSKPFEARQLRLVAQEVAAVCGEVRMTSFGRGDPPPTPSS